MIVNGAYFIGDIYLPYAKPGVTSGVSDVENDIKIFINEYEVECLEKCLGLSLFNEFADNLDTTESDYIKDGSDTKWNQLLNGHSYTNPNGDEVVWKGIRRKTKELGVDDSDEYNKSFLADYIYFFHEKSNFVKRAGIGQVKIDGANSTEADPTHKAVKAWNRFVETVQGEVKPNIYVKSGQFGGGAVDWFTGQDNGKVTLYRFIEDMNQLQENTYPNFKPKNWSLINSAGM